MPPYQREAKIPHKKANELYEQTAKDIHHLFEKSQISNAQFSFHPEKNTLEVKHSLFSATLHCLDGCIRVEGQLSFLAVPFKNKIDETIDRWLQKTFSLQSST